MMIITITVTVIIIIMKIIINNSICDAAAESNNYDNGTNRYDNNEKI